MITRIRFDNEIVGFKRVQGSYTFYSKDLYGWNGTPIDHTIEEKATPFKDKNAQSIFENDVLNISKKSSEEQVVYVVRNRENQFYLEEFNSGTKKEIMVLANANYSVKKVGVLESIN